MRFRPTSISAIAAAIVLTALSPSSAYASFLDDATSELQLSNVYVSPSAAMDAATIEEITQATKGTTIAVAVFPDSSSVTEEGDADYYLQSLAGRTSFDTFVVAIGDDLEAGSRNNSIDADDIANRAEVRHAETGPALIEFVTEVQTQSENSVAASDGGVPMGVIGSIGGSVLVLFAVAAFARQRLMRRGNTRKDTTVRQMSTSILSEKLRKQLITVCDLAQQTSSQPIIESIANARDDILSLFTVLRDKQSDRIHEATAQNEIALDKVKKVLDTYLEVQANPRHYPGYVDMLSQAEQAIDGYESTVLEHVRRVKHDEITDFKVHVRMLASDTDNNPTFK